MDKVFYHVRNVAHGPVIRHVGYQQVFDAHAFVNHRRYHEEEQSREDGTYYDEGAEYAQDALLHAASVLEEFDQRKQDIGNEPCQKERQQY